MSDRLVVVGSINVDRTIEVGRFPRPGETLLASSLTTAIGGKGANQAAAAAYSGATVSMVAVLGDDADGDLALGALGDTGVRTDEVRRAPGVPTGSAWITVSRGENTILVVPGANHQWQQGIPQLAPDDVVLCQLEIPPAVVESTALTAGRLLLNASPSMRLSDELLQHCEVLIVNEHELAEVSGHHDVDVCDPTSIVTASRVLLDRGSAAVATTLGSRGAMLCTAEDTFIATTPPTPEVVDSTGAGDAFCGVFAARLAQGASLPEALRYAVTAGSLAVQHATAQGGYDTFDRLSSVIHETPAITTESSA